MSGVDTARALIDAHGRTLAQAAGIELTDEPGPLWELLVLTQLLSNRISSDVAVTTARLLFEVGWRTPAALHASTGRQRVDVLGRGGYRRYDVRTAARLDENATLVLDRWGGDLRRLRDEAADPVAVAMALRTFTGIGPTAAAIFLREVQVVWPQVHPAADLLVLKGAAIAGLPAETAALAALVPQEDFAALCAALVRVARRPTLLR